MSKIDIQEQLCNVLTGLFRDPKEARQYAEDPQRYIGEKVGHDADYSQVDMKHVVDYSVAQAEVAPEVADAMYQPAPTIRVPYPKEERVAEQNDDRDDYKADDYKAEPNDVVDHKADDYRVEDHKAEPYDGDPKVDRPAHDGHEEPPIREDHEAPMGRDPMPPKEQPNHDVEYPKEVAVEKVDDYYKATPNDGATPAEEYTPDKWTPDCEITEECVTYSVSNCVTEVYKDQPEIADRLCETRDYTDPYPRLCPEDDYSDLITEIEPMYDTPKYDGDDKYDDEAEKYEAEKYEADDAYGKDVDDMHKDGMEPKDDYDGTYKPDEQPKGDDHKADDYKADDYEAEKYEAEKYEAEKYEADDAYGKDVDDMHKDGMEPKDDYDGTYKPDEQPKDDDYKADDYKDQQNDEYKADDYKDQQADEYGKDGMELKDDYDGTYKPVEEPMDDYGNGHQPEPAYKDEAQHDDRDRVVDDYGNGDKAGHAPEYVDEPAAEMAPTEMVYEEAQPEPMAYEAPHEEVVTYEEPTPIVEHVEAPVEVHDAPMDDMMIED